VDEVVVFLDLGHVMGGESQSGGIGCGARLRGKDLSATAPPCSAPLPCAEARALVPRMHAAAPAPHATMALNC
jgi:hypothetical protein